jgi:hypothetical protein
VQRGLQQCEEADVPPIRPASQQHGHDQGTGFKPRRRLLAAAGAADWVSPTAWGRRQLKSQLGRRLAPMRGVLPHYAVPIVNARPDGSEFTTAQLISERPLV